MKFFYRKKSKSSLARARAEIQLARREIREGRFQRSMALMAAFAAIVSGLEAYMQHLRGAFDHWLMWTPVALTPPMVGAAGAAIVSKRAAHSVLPFLSVAMLADGVIGFFYHVRGVRRMPGGLQAGQYNIVMGPPLLAPLLMCIVGALGLLARFLRRERLEASRLQVADFRLRKRSKPGSKAGNLESEIARGQFQQGMAFLSSAFAALAGGEAYFEHLRGSYNQRLMWTPVWVTPLMVGAGIGAAWNKTIAQRVLPFVAAATFLDGLLGFLLHLRGLKRMPGGLTDLEFKAQLGPPVFAPLLFCAVGLLGFIAVLLRRDGNS